MQMQRSTSSLQFATCQIRLYPSPGDKQQCKALFKNHVELRIARHIADGAKHFKVTQPQHTQVVGTSE